MEAYISVKFVKINGFKVDDKLLKMTPNLPNVTEKTVEILCTQIKKYFQDHNIEVKTSFELK